MSGTLASSPVRAQDLAKTYPSGMAAVRSLDLELRPGEVFGLLGPNGAGKTTTVGMLTTRVRPSGGRAWVGGASLAAAAPTAGRSTLATPRR